MFKKLRNRLISINLGITTLVILITFTSIYIISTNSANNRPPVMKERIIFESDETGEAMAEFERSVRLSIENEKQAAARDLLILLIVSGVLIEFVVAIISYYLAEEAIKPVREAYDTQKIFIANASHEIKTPLAAISANLEAADIKGNHWINNIEKETTKLTELNSELLTLARSDLAKDVKMEEIDVARAISDSLSSFEPRLGNLKLVKKITSQGKVKTSGQDLLQIFSILMDNAIKYAETKIEVELTGREMLVKNDTPTISSKDLPHLFDRFYQVDKSSEGVGLGLSIAKSIADHNNWDLGVSQTKKIICFKLKY